MTLPTCRLIVIVAFSEKLTISLPKDNPAGLFGPAALHFRTQPIRAFPDYAPVSPERCSPKQSDLVSMFPTALDRSTLSVRGRAMVQLLIVPKKKKNSILCKRNAFSEAYNLRFS